VTRDTLLKAIKAGQKRGASPESIADAIELALEMESDGDAEVHEITYPLLDIGPRTEPLPPNPSSVVVGVTAPPEPPPIPKSTPSGLVLASSDRDIDRELERSKKPAPIRSLFAPTRAPGMRLQEAVQFWTDNAPETLDIIPEGLDQAITLERNIQSLPGMAIKGKRSSDFVKLSYKHPNAQDVFEVSYPVAVADMGDTLDIMAVIEKLKADAAKVYKPRPRSPVVKMPPLPDLRYDASPGNRDGRGMDEGTPEDQDRYAAAAKQGKEAVAALAKNIAGSALEGKLATPTKFQGRQ
jgi:hypothetical protein